MGSAFYRDIHGSVASVGLLNVGEEDQKDLIICVNSSGSGRNSLNLNYNGFVEGSDIAGKVDVVVTDGFSGNVALKTAEGVADLFRVDCELHFPRIYRQDWAFCWLVLACVDSDTNLILGDIMEQFSWIEQDIGKVTRGHGCIWIFECHWCGRLYASTRLYLVKSAIHKARYILNKGINDRDE